MINIRNIELSDKKTYVDFAEKFYKSPAVLHEVDKSYFSKTFDFIINDNTYAQAFIIEYNKNNAGYALISKTYSQEICSMVLLIEEIFVDDEYRQKGIAKEVFRFLHEKFKDYKRFRLELTKDNKVAMEIYKNLGYEVLDYIQMIRED